MEGDDKGSTLKLIPKPQTFENEDKIPTSQLKLYLKNSYHTTGNRGGQKNHCTVKSFLSHVFGILALEIFLLSVFLNNDLWMDQKWQNGFLLRLPAGVTPVQGGQKVKEKNVSPAFLFS